MHFHASIYVLAEVKNAGGWPGVTPAGGVWQMAFEQLFLCSFECMEHMPSPAGAVK